MPAFHDFEVCRNILESLQTGLCVLNMERKIVYWSDGAERMTGYLRHEVAGRPAEANFLEHCDRNHCESCGEQCPLGAAVHNSKPAEATAWLHHKAGHRIAALLRAVPVRDTHGSIIGVAASFEEQQPAESVDHHEDGLKAAGCVDDITGVASHAIMQSHLRETLATFVELNVPFGILMVRLEGLDKFRAGSGQEAASTLLRAVARTLEGALWRTDFVGRWSDDQFLIILNGCSEDSLRAVRERIRRLVASEEIEWWGERRSLPIAMGQASARARDNLDALLARAQHSLNDDAHEQAHAPAEARSRGAAGN